jgi:hypothetical protein
MRNHLGILCGSFFECREIAHDVIFIASLG